MPERASLSYLHPSCLPAVAALKLLEGVLPWQSGTGGVRVLTHGRGKSACQSRDGNALLMIA